jgi:hypothetical protein
MQRLSDAVKRQRDRNREPSEPVGQLPVAEVGFKLMISRTS